MATLSSVFIDYLFWFVMIIIGIWGVGFFLQYLKTREKQILIVSIATLVIASVFFIFKIVKSIVSPIHPILTAFYVVVEIIAVIVVLRFFPSESLRR